MKLDRHRISTGIVLAAAALAVGAHLWLVARTVWHPWQLEWMEGGVVDTATRLRAGESIYPAPSVDRVGYVYTPLYFAILAAIPDGALVAGRLISVLSTLASFALVFTWIRRETESNTLAAAGVALLAASQGIVGFWFHLARVDSLALALTAGALYVLAHGTSRRSAVGAAALAVLAVLTKQSMGIAIVPALVALAFVDPRRAGIAGLAFGGALAVTALALTAATSGWFLYYTVDLPGQHGLALGDALVHGGARLAILAPALVACIAFLVGALRDRAPRAKLDVAIFAGLFLSAWLGLAHPGGYWNVLAPACVALAIYAPVAVHRLRRSALIPLLAAQIVAPIVLFPPTLAVPSEDGEARAERFLAWLEDQPGEPLVPDLRHFQTLAGKPSHGLGQAARDVLMAHPGDRGRRMLEESLALALAEQRFSVIVTSQRDWLGDALEVAYVADGEIDAPAPAVGAQRLPRWVWRPRGQSGSQGPSQ